MPVPDVDRYRPDDRRAVEALYRRVFGTDAADASRLRWEWQYRRNPNNPGGEPEIWIAREGPAIIGQYATMPVKLAATMLLLSLTVALQPGFLNSMMSSGVRLMESILRSAH